ncbi:MAG: DUF4330 domain-containing protein [Microcoleaceae cyanobacterium]
MKILDNQGRLFGKISLLDFGALFVILMVLVGIFIFPGTSVGSNPTTPGTSPANIQTIEVDAIALGVKGRKPEALLKAGEKTNVIVRNQPYGQLDIKSVEVLTRMLAVPQPDGSVKAVPDPREEEAFSRNLMLTLAGPGQVTPDGIVIGNLKVKVGSTIELDGKNYNFNVSVIDMRVLDKK